MKKFLRVTGWTVASALLVIQFFRPEKNRETTPSPHHISTAFAIPDDVNLILKKACNDCHSNHSEYPWYFNFQPVGIWINGHIKDGKQHLNFSEYTNKRLRYQYHKMEEVIEMVKDGEMPLESYTWTHKDARLTDEEKNKLINWAQSVMDDMKSRYPVDSLMRQSPS